VAEEWGLMGGSGVTDDEGMEQWLDSILGRRVWIQRVTREQRKALRVVRNNVKSSIMNNDTGPNIQGRGGDRRAVGWGTR